MNRENNKLIIFSARIIQYIFEASFIAFIIFFFLEYFKNGLVTNYFNFNILLILCVFFGILTVLLVNQKSADKRQKGIIVSALISIAGGLIIYLILPDTYLIYSIAPFVSAISIFVILLIIQKND